MMSVPLRRKTLSRSAPPRGMLGSGDAIAGAVGGIGGGKIGGIKLVEKLDRSEGVCPEEIKEMRGAADGRGFLGRDAAESEVVELEGEERRITSADEGFADDLLDGAGKGGHGDGIPNLQKNGFGPVGKPIKLGVGVFNGDERVMAFDDGAFLDGADAEGEASAMLGVERLESVVVKGFRVAVEMRVGHAAGFLDVVEGEDLSGEIGFDDVLEHGEHGFVEHAAAGFDVGVDVARVGGILPPVGELVGVGVEDGIEAQGLHGFRIAERVARWQV
jgi:hypothetical protein